MKDTKAIRGIGYFVAVFSMMLGLAVFAVGVNAVWLWLGGGFFHLFIGVLMIIAGIKMIKELKIKK
ncbi:MAG: hypothetical protein M0O93_06950 [Bacteroidales bacterium]|nr:hypothetical protein [Bacteroidales bacterium]